jgi:hypothetical protein
MHAENIICLEIIHDFLWVELAERLASEKVLDG